MSKSRVNRPLGWVSPVQAAPSFTRQQARASLRHAAWIQFSGPPMRDEGGIIPRWLRRAMALGLARKMWQAKKEMHEQDNLLERVPDVVEVLDAT